MGPTCHCNNNGKVLTQTCCPRFGGVALKSVRYGSASSATSPIEAPPPPPMESLWLAVCHRPVLPLPTPHNHHHHCHRNLHLQPSPNSLSLSVPICPRLSLTHRRHLPPLLASASAASPAPAVSPIPNPAAGGAKPLPLILSLAAGLAVRFLVPKPAEVTPQAWQLLSIFLTTIAGLVLGPLPVGAWAFLGLTATVATRTLPFTAAFGAFTNEVIWLIVISFFFARGFVKTGLGDRVATYFVKWLGRSTLGLSYGLAISEAFIAPAMPSTTARAGGVFLPIVKSLSLSSGSKPNDSSSKKLGAYLIQSQLQVINKEIDDALELCLHYIDVTGGLLFLTGIYFA
jgi:hypothetical protein